MQLTHACMTAFFENAWSCRSFNILRAASDNFQAFSPSIVKSLSPPSSDLPTEAFGVAASQAAEARLPLTDKVRAVAVVFRPAVSYSFHSDTARYISWRSADLRSRYHSRHTHPPPTSDLTTCNSYTRVAHHRTTPRICH
jgi:hypothetical protein